MQHGGTLLRILDSSNWNFLKAELLKHYTENSFIYIGLSDLISNGLFEWETSLNDINKDGVYTKYIYPFYGERWCQNEPNSKNSLECVALRIQRDYICYEDRNCSKYGFYACELRKLNNKNLIRKFFFNNPFAEKYELTSTRAVEIEKINQSLMQTVNEIENYRQSN